MDTHGTHGRAHTSTRKTQTNLTTIQAHQHTRTTARRPIPRPAQQPQPRSRTLPAADSEEAAPPSEPDPAASRSESASPRLLEGGRRNEGTDTVTARAGLVPVPCERSFFHIAKSVAFPVASWPHLTSHMISPIYRFWGRIGCELVCRVGGSVLGFAVFDCFFVIVPR